MVVCPSCGTEYSRPGQHWNLSTSCSYPDIPSESIEIIIGTVMGDATLSSADGNINHNIRVVKKEYLNYLSEKFPDWFIPGEIYLAEGSGESHDYQGREITRHQDYWGLLSVRHPTLTDLRKKWYNGSKKRFPDDLSLTPRITKHWFVNDGSSYIDHTDRPIIQFASVNESTRPEYILGLFEDQGFNPYFSSGHHFRIPSYEVNEFFDWIGDPIPGYEYKWKRNI